MSVIVKKLKNASHFININCMEKFQITDPPIVWVSGFLSVNRNGISALAIMKKLKNCSHSMKMEDHQKTGDGDVYFLFSEFSIGSFFPITHPRFHFNIYAWLHLKHLCVVYLMSHLCVVLHFLIFYNVERFKLLEQQNGKESYLPEDLKYL